MFGKYMLSELKKYLYHKWLLIVMFIIAILIPIMVISLDSFIGEKDIMLMKSRLLRGFNFSQVGYIVLTALYYGQEYQKSALRTSLLCSPNRILFQIVKICCNSLWTLLLLTITTIISILLLGVSSDASVSLENICELINSLIPAYCSTFELTLITGSIVIITKSTIASIAIMTSMILGLGNILLQYGKFMKYLPVNSVMNGFMIKETSMYLSINTGLIVQGIWCLSLLFIAGILFCRRCAR